MKPTRFSRSKRKGAQNKNKLFTVLHSARCRCQHTELSGKKSACADFFGSALLVKARKKKIKVCQFLVVRKYGGFAVFMTISEKERMLDAHKMIFVFRKGVPTTY